MLTSRDRLLAAVFALQLLAAAVLGGVLVSRLDDPAATSQLVQAGTAPGAAPTASASAAAGARGTAGTAGTVGTAGGAAATTGGGAAGGDEVTAPGRGTTSVPRGGVIKVGTVVTQTGAINFAASAQATKAYFDMVNRAGGVNGRMIQLDLRDDQLDSARGRQQAQQLLAGGAFAFVAWNAPLTENSIVPFLEQNAIPMVGAYGQQQEYHSRQSFIFSASYGHYGFQMGKWLGEQPGVDNPGVVFIDNMSPAANDGLEAGFRAGLEAAGKELPKDNVVVADATRPSYDDVVTQFRLSGVDGMATVLDQTAYNRLQQSQDRQSYRPAHVAVPLLLDATVNPSPSTEGVFVASDFLLPGSGAPAVREYEETVRRAFGAKAQVNYIGEQGWVGAKAFVDALRRMGDDITRANLIRTLEATDGRSGYGFTAPLVFGPYAKDTRDINRCLRIAKIAARRATDVTGWRCDSQPF